MARTQVASRQRPSGKPLARPRGAVRRLQRYFCGATLTYSDCNHGTFGAFDERRVTRSLADCVAMRRGCANCNFVSFSRANSDCSWFNACNVSALHSPTYENGKTYVTVHVKTSG